MAENAADLSKSYERNLTYRIFIHNISVTPKPLIPMRCNDGILERHACEYDCFAGSRELS